MAEKRPHYVNKKELMAEIHKYKDDGVISDEFGRMIFTIARNYANKGSFANYSWKRDMVADAVLTCVKYIHNFDPNKYEKPNPFAYITTICHRAFLNHIKKQKKHSKIKDVCYNNSHLLMEDDQYIKKGINYEILKSED